ncbi:MAG TPA: hypothetical protein VEK08_16870 [Planctomycetota bacterium]|nr:hypothetical protein [Planctomycetota bacterium]
MRTWGVGIFDNDLAVAIKADFEKLVADGDSVFAAADKLIEKYSEANSSVMYLALASLQLDYDVIHPKIKKRALTAIISGNAAEAWEESGTAVFENRKAVLQELRQRLLAVPT